MFLCDILEPIQNDLEYAITSTDRLMEKMAHLVLTSYPDTIVLFTADVTDLYPSIRTNTSTNTIDSTITATTTAAIVAKSTKLGTKIHYVGTKIYQVEI